MPLSVLPLEALCSHLMCVKMQRGSSLHTRIHKSGPPWNCFVTTVTSCKKNRQVCCQEAINLKFLPAYELCIVSLTHFLTYRWPLQPGGELGPGPADRGGVHHQPRRAGLLRMPGRLQPAQQLPLDHQEPQRHAGRHRGPPAGGALLQAGPGWGVPVPRLQQRDEEAGRGPVHAGRGQLRDRWERVERGWILGILWDKRTVNSGWFQKQRRLMSHRDED